MITATYDNTVVGDRLYFPPLDPIEGNEFSGNHFDTVVRKYDKGSKMLVLDCNEKDTGKPWTIQPNEVESYGFGIELRQPSKPEADQFGWFSTFYIERSIPAQPYTFKLYHDCAQCEANYRLATDPAMAGHGYVPHYFSQACRSGKRPHCTCDTCF